MSYTAFTDEVVFENPEANIACNRLYEILQFKTSANVEEAFALTLDAARIIQGDPVTEINNIAFATDSLDIFEFLVKKIGGFLEIKEQINFNDRIQITYSKTVLIEIWLVDDLGTINVIDSLIVQDPADMPA